MNNEEILHDIDTRLFSLSFIENAYDIITPLNVVSERELFFSKQGVYEPQFTYATQDFTSEIKELQEMKIPSESFIGALLEEKRKHLLAFFQAMQHIGTDLFSTNTIYPPVPEYVLERMNQLLEEELPIVKQVNQPINSEQLVDILKKELAKYGLEGWTITLLSEGGSTVAINSAKKTIFVHSNERFTEEHVHKLCIHEIGTHVLRAENGSKQTYKLFSSGTVHYLATEEGLAGYNERHEGVFNPDTLRSYAKRALATHVARTKSFSEVYAQIRPISLSDKDAFGTTLRVKRGLSDTSKPGGYLKDHAYLQGMLDVERYVEQGGDIRKLYAGKIKTEQAYLLDEGVLDWPEQLPYFYTHAQINIIQNK